MNELLCSKYCVEYAFAMGYIHTSISFSPIFSYSSTPLVSHNSIHCGRGRTCASRTSCSFRSLVVRLILFCVFTLLYHHAYKIHLFRFHSCKDASEVEIFKLTSFLLAAFFVSYFFKIEPVIAGYVFLLGCTYVLCGAGTMRGFHHKNSLFVTFIWLQRDC